MCDCSSNAALCFWQMCTCWAQVHGASAINDWASYYKERGIPLHSPAGAGCGKTAVSCVFGASLLPLILNSSCKTYVQCSECSPPLGRAPDALQRIVLSGWKERSCWPPQPAHTPARYLHQLPFHTACIQGSASQLSIAAEVVTRVPAVCRSPEGD